MKILNYAVYKYILEPQLHPKIQGNHLIPRHISSLKNNLKTLKNVL
jgi:hypothetical protein